MLDSRTDRGVPLVELETVNRLKFVTDSAGRIAFCEPGLTNRSVFFHVRSHGYESPKDGFGLAGVRLRLVPGTNAVIKLNRLNIAERLYRVTGEGIYRDTVLLGKHPPLAEPLLNANVAGQDSIQPAIYRGRIFWFWGDTPFMSYPLGNFRMSGATSELSARGGLDPDVGIDLRYFTNAEGSAKQMCPIEPPGELIWIDGVCVLRDGSGRERMIGHYQRLKGLSKPLARGLVIYDDEKDAFAHLKKLDLEDTWRFPHGRPAVPRDEEAGYFHFGDALPNVRVRAELSAFTNAAAYEAFTCVSGTNVAGDPVLARDARGALQWRWQKELPPMNEVQERDLVQRGLLGTNETRFSPVDADSGQVVQMHAGTVRWNGYRKRWILVAVQQYGTSFLGEVWYAEAAEPTGPWRRAKKIVTHDKYSFYNPAHHAFFDQDGGRLIYFEGTYAEMFSGSAVPTPRYDYNQLMYRLDLSDPRLRSAQE